VEEFAPPFARTRLINLVLVLLAAAVISVAFLLTMRRLTHSLGVLTAAADEVAQGNFQPNLPPPSGDEVGRLSTAFGLMVREVRDMLRRIQESRHLAVVGQFASQLSHEIRNPLTSIKLNLQRLKREVESDRISGEYAGPIDICLREVQRLDRVAGGVLGIARTRSHEREPCSVHHALNEALEALRPQFEERGIAVHTQLDASADMVSGDAQQLRGVFLNLFLNAVDAMPDGGALKVMTEAGVGGTRSTIRVRVADTGPGVPPDVRDRIFEPFVSTKEEGTGFGLALAQQAVEEHGGMLRLEDRAEDRRGAVFVVELPLVVEEVAR
jgi:signal transduction histidine kinase